MTPRTSSGSWSGAERGAGRDAGRGAGRAGADIIDLDRYMRGTRPARAPPRPDNLNSSLVVDAGLGARAPAPAPRSGPSSRSSGARGERKRFSHDSGLSDTSCARRPHAHRPHRCVGGTQVSAPAGDARAPGSSASLRAFRASLERALRDQQAQIARVAQLCERQACRRPERRTEHRAERRTERRTTTDSTELSSSSRSSKDPRHADKHRTSECKTYKIIMSKLDELNRLFAARGARPASPAAPAPPAPALRRDSSGSVTVSDKLVATDFPQQSSGRRVSSRRLVERGAGGECRRGDAARDDSGARRGGSGVGRGGTRVIACAHSIDIPPRSNMATESVVRAGSSEESDEDSDAGSADSGGSGGSALRDGFDLDDPVHLYAQAKRLQAMHATTRRARSAECAARARSALGSELGAARGAREPSLCALCRGYWRLARRCLTAPLAGMRL